jgi:hypothetical protein
VLAQMSFQDKYTCSGFDGAAWYSPDAVSIERFLQVALARRHAYA